MHITAVSTAFPSHRYRQTEIAEALSARWGHKMEEPRLLGRLHANCGVEWRNLVLPLGEYPKIETFTQANDQWIASALTLGERAVNSVLEKAGLKAEQEKEAARLAAVEEENRKRKEAEAAEGEAGEAGAAGGYQRCCRRSPPSCWSAPHRHAGDAAPRVGGA